MRTSYAKSLSEVTKMQVQIERPKQKSRQPTRPPFILHCPFGDGHEWAVAASFLDEATLFELQAEPTDLICKKCWGLRREYEVVKK